MVAITTHMLITHWQRESRYFDLGLNYFLYTADHGRVALNKDDDKEDGPYINAVYLDVSNYSSFSLILENNYDACFPLLK